MPIYFSGNEGQDNHEEEDMEESSEDPEQSEEEDKDFPDQNENLESDEVSVQQARTSCYSNISPYEAFKGRCTSERQGSYCVERWWY